MSVCLAFLKECILSYICVQTRIEITSTFIIEQRTKEESSYYGDALNNSVTINNYVINFKTLNIRMVGGEVNERNRAKFMG